MRWLFAFVAMIGRSLATNVTAPTPLSSEATAANPQSSPSRNSCLSVGLVTLTTGAMFTGGGFSAAGHTWAPPILQVDMFPDTSRATTVTLSQPSSSKTGSSNTVGLPSTATSVWPPCSSIVAYSVAATATLSMPTLSVAR